MSNLRLKCPTGDNCQKLDEDSWCASFRSLIFDRYRACVTLEPPPDDPFALPVVGPCWVWPGVSHPKGYKHVRVGRVQRKVHRVMAAAVGTPIRGMVIDHLCRNRGCCNPAHLEAVTTQQNTQRGVTARKTHCKRGHLLTTENLYIDPGGYRKCKLCRRGYDLARRPPKRRAS